MNRIQWKDLLREIRKNKGRFFSLLFIVALGCAFYSGIRSSEPDMTTSADRYFDEANFCDIRIISTLGLTDDDLQAIAHVEGVRECEGAYSVELFADVENDEPVVNAVSLGKSLNQFTIREGRMPQDPSECFVDVAYRNRTHCQIGDTITLLDTDKGVPEALTRNTFTVVGYGTWAWYLNLTRGSASIGDGSMDAFAVLLPEAFDQDYYSTIYATVEGAMDENCYTEPYDQIVDAIKDALEDVSGVQVQVRRDQLVQEGEEKLADAREQIADAKQELADALEKLNDGEAEYADGKSEYEKGCKELADGKKEYQDGLKTYADGKKKYEDGKSEYEKGLAAYRDGLAQYQDGASQLADGKKQLEASRKQLDEGWAAYQDGLSQYEEGAALLAAKEKEAEEGEALLTEAEQQVAEQKAAVLEQKETLLSQKEQLEDGLEQIADGLLQLEDAPAQIEDGLKQIDDGLAQIEDGLQQIEDGLKQADSALPLLKASQRLLNAGVITAERALAAAEKNLVSVEKELSDVAEELAAAEGELAEMKKQLADVSEEDESATAEELKARISELETGIDSLKTRQTRLERQKTTVAWQVAALQRAYDEAVKQKALLDEQVKTVEDQRAEAIATREELEKTKADLIQQKADLIQQKENLPQMKEELLAKQEELEKNLPLLEDGLKQIEDGLKQIEDGEKELAAKRGELEDGRKQLEDGKAELEASARILEDSRKQLEDGEAAYESGAAVIAENEKKLADAKAILNSSKPQLEEAGRQVAAGKKELDQGARELNEAKKTIEDGEAELADARQTLEDGRKELDDGWAEYRDGKAEADEKIADAEIEIADGEQKLKDIPEGKWYVLGRDTIQTAVEYGMDAERIGKIATVFPVIFFLVAALVCLTTMTRMIEEERMIIGTMKALGYGKGAIVAKYLIYAGAATLSGGILGVLIGSKILPYVIMTAYGMLYTNVPYRLLPYHMSYCLISIGMALVCTVGAALAACYKELLSTPAALMRPPAPKHGKKILLERIPFLWSRMNFSMKSTVRNLLRYKKRLFMTVLGIGGCMAILLVSYGLHDSIFAIVDNQYTRIWTYSASGGLDDKWSLEEQEALRDQLVADQEHIEDGLLVRNISLDASTDAATKSVYLYVVEDAERMEPFLNLHDRVSREQHSLTDDGVIISEKLARTLEVENGDEITLKISDTEYKQVKVTASAENYLHNYVYMTPAFYQQVYGEAPAFNELMIRYDRPLEEEEEGQLSEVLLGTEGITSISLVTKLQDQVNNMLNALNLVVWVLVIAAGLLVFVVTFNLNNINISERRRELASLKVLGFYDGEVAMYVYRENVFLTLFGIIAGLFMGTWLHRYVITTLEVEMIMFGRNISLASYGYSSLLTAIFSVLVNLLMYYKLRQINMVESLKSVE